MITKLIYLDTINFEASPKVRHKVVNDEVVQQYAQNYMDKREMPPIVVFWDSINKIHMLADGRHRCAANELIKRKATMAVVHNGDYGDCLKFALLANSYHGLPRTNSDKRQCIIVTIKQWPDLSNIHTAKMCDVDDKTVASVRSELEKKKVIPKTPVRIGTDGRTFEVEPSRVVAATIAIDTFGKPIPKSVIKYWDRSEEPKEMIRQVSNIVKFFKGVEQEKDPMYGELNFTGIMADLGRVVESLKTAIPYCVCTQCQGHPETQPKSECRLCLGRGLISKFRFDTAVPQEIKDIMKGKKK